mmetsp:Transcript_25601/g.29411  ORF Transcript_25601/g.29411 Transcript_25601/m.29411 type:complete len:280 (+) Transcript_25601:40-879(+)
MESAVYQYATFAPRVLLHYSKYFSMIRPEFSFLGPYSMFGSCFILGIYSISEMTYLYNLYKSANIKESKEAQVYPILRSENKDCLDLFEGSSDKDLYTLVQSANMFSMFEDGNSETSKKIHLNKNIEDYMSTLNGIYESSKVTFINTRGRLANPKEEVITETKIGVLSGVEKAGLKYLDLTFREPKVHRAILDVLNSAIKEKSFVDESKRFGIDLINDVCKDSVFQLEIKKSSLKIVKHDDIKHASVDLLKEVVHHPTTKFFVTKMMKDVMQYTEAREV